MGRASRYICVTTRRRTLVDLVERGFDSLKKQRATHSFPYRLRHVGPVLVVAVSLFVSGAHGDAVFGQFPDTSQHDGVVTIDTYGGIGLVRSPDARKDFFTELQAFQISEDYVINYSSATQDETFFALPFFVGFDILRDLDLIANKNDEAVGAIAVDGFGGVHTFSVEAADSPDFDYFRSVLDYNARTLTPGLPASNYAGTDMRDLTLGLPYFSWDIVRDLELATDWRAATNSFQGYYLLDGFGGIHYVNDAEVLAMIQREVNAVEAGIRTPSDPLLAGTEDFFSLFGFRPIYRRHYVGSGFDGTEAEADYLSRSPYVQNPGFARDLEVSVRFFSISTAHVTQSKARANLAVTFGIATSTLSTPIGIADERADVTSPEYGRDTAVTNGYYILSSYGLVHSMLEDGKGKVIPALWEDPETGLYDSRVNAPYFGMDIAEDLELFPNGLGFAVLTSWGGIELVCAPGTEISDSFDVASFAKKELDIDPSSIAPFFGFDIARGLKFVTSVDRENYGLDPDGDGEPAPADAKHGKITGYYVIDGFGSVHARGQAAKLPMNGSVLPLYGVDVAADVEVSPVFRPVTDSVDVLSEAVSEAVPAFSYPVSDSI